VSNRSSYRARITKLRARAGCSPRVEALASRSNGGGAEARRAMVVDSGCIRKRSGERGPGAAGGERAHRRVSRVADGKAKLTVALDGAWEQQRPRNRQWASAGGGGALGSRGQSEREGEGAGQRAQMREGRWASRARGSKGARELGRGRRTCGRGRVHGGRSWARG
jgi:hypothetical protein